MSTNTTLAANRINIPAIARVPGRGTATLVSPGLLLTSTRVVGSRHEASKLSAIFFESGKQGAVSVKLLPQQFYFASVYPEHLDYCLVACETKGIYNVTPVKLPLVRSEWMTVREGDSLLLVQHPLDDTDPNQNLEVKRFDEVLRRRDDLLYLKPQGAHSTSACPAFNDNAQIVGLQTQFVDDIEGSISRVVSIVTIIKHLFANGKLSTITQSPLFEDVWDTWYVPGDTTRIIAIMNNFRQKDVTRQAAEKLCEHTSKRELMDGIVSCGGTKVITDCINQFRDDERMVSIGLRSLWNISFGEVDNRHHIADAGGIQTILWAMKEYPKNEEVGRFGVVLLFNLTLSRELIGTWCSEALHLVYAEMKLREGVEVQQKFGMGFMANLAKCDVKYARELLDLGMMDHVKGVITTMSKKNEYLIEHAVELIHSIVEHPSYQGHSALEPIVHPLLECIALYPSNCNINLKGNNALWSLGMNPKNRVSIFAHEKGIEVLRASLSAVSAKTSV